MLSTVAKRKEKSSLHGDLVQMSGPGQTLSCKYDRRPGCSEPWRIFEIAFVFRSLLSFAIFRGAFEGNECSVSIRPMKYEPLVPWKPESARTKLKEDGVKVPGGSREVGLGHGAGCQRQET